MQELRIHVATHSQYTVFDASGRLSFSVVSGLCRHSSTDTDSRPLTLDTRKSVFDVPYALANGRLALYEQDENDQQHTEVDLQGLSWPESDQESLVTLSSPINRASHWRDAFTSFHYCIEPASALGRRLQVGKQYHIRLASQDLAVKWWTFGSAPNSGSRLSETARLINQRSPEGRASFTVVPSLPWLPKVETHLRLRQDEERPSNMLEVAVTNTGAKAVTVQTRGQQHHLFPSGPFQPEEWSADHRPRIIDAPNDRDPISALQVVSLDAGAVVYEPPRSSPASSTRKHDPRPKLDTLVVLKPNEPLVRNASLKSLLARLPDGEYAVRLSKRGVWWCLGSVEDMGEKGSDRVRKELFISRIPPLMLESEDVVRVRVANAGAVP